MDETDEPRARLCGNCATFSVLDDMPRDPDRWFGFCGREMEETAPCRGCGMWRAMDWTYDHGRHGRDGCERPGEWFEGVADD